MTNKNQNEYTNKSNNKTNNPEGIKIYNTQLKTKTDIQKRTTKSINTVQQKQESIWRMTTESRERQKKTFLESKGIVHNKIDTNQV